MIIMMMNFRDEPIKQVRKDDKTCLSLILNTESCYDFFFFAFYSLNMARPLSRSFRVCVQVACHLTIIGFRRNHLHFSSYPRAAYTEISASAIWLHIKFHKDYSSSSICTATTISRYVGTYESFQFVWATSTDLSKSFKP